MILHKLKSPLYDTILFPRPIACPTCGKLYYKTTTRQFNNSMVTYEVGDLLPTHVSDDIVEGRYGCDHGVGGNPENIEFFTVYFVIYHKMLIDVVVTPEEGRKKQDSFGFEDLLLLYEGIYKERNDFKEKYVHLKKRMQTYANYLKLPLEEKKKVWVGPPGSIPYMNIIPHLDQQDPIASIISELDEKDYSIKNNLIRPWK